jgi:hypothetical protein
LSALQAYRGNANQKITEGRRGFVEAHNLHFQPGIRFEGAASDPPELVPLKKLRGVLETAKQHVDYFRRLLDFANALCVELFTPGTLGPFDTADLMNDTLSTQDKVHLPCLKLKSTGLPPAAKVAITSEIEVASATYRDPESKNRKRNGGYVAQGGHAASAQGGSGAGGTASLTPSSVQGLAVFAGPLANKAVRKYLANEAGKSEGVLHIPSLRM